MEEEVDYSTVFFKDAPPSKEKKEDLTIYSEVKSKESVSAATAPEKKEEPAIYSEVKSKESVAAATTPKTKEEPAIYCNVQSKESVSAATAPEKKEEPAIYSEAKPKKSAPTDGKAAAHSHIHLLLLCLGILCLLLTVTVIVIVVHIFSVTKEKDRQEAKLRVMTAENKNLTSLIGDIQNNTEQLIRDIENKTELIRDMEKKTEQLIRDIENKTELIRDMEKKAEELMRDRDDLNHTLGVILKFKSFPVTDFCPGPMGTDCNPCQKGWLPFQDKCYLFYKEAAPWKTWQESREFCQNKSADLVVINNQEEQEFISNHTTYYYDDNHGYWIGLRKINKDWVWIDGRNDTLGYWIPDGGNGSFALLIPKKEPTKSWNKVNNAFLNRFVCEMDALIRSR